MSFSKVKESVIAHKKVASLLVSKNKLGLSEISLNPAKSTSKKNLN